MPMVTGPEFLFRRTEAVVASRSVVSFASLTGFAALVTWAAASGPLEGFFQLGWRGPSIALVILGGAELLNLAALRWSDSPWLDNAAGAAVSGGIYLFCCALILESRSDAGSAVFGSFLLFSASLHAHIQQLDFRTPLVPFLLVLVAAASYAVWPQAAAAPVLLVSTAASVVGSLFVGTFAATAERHRRERDQLRQTISAQALASEAREREQLNERLISVLGEQHDIRNKVATALLNAEALSHMSREDDAFCEIVDDITDALMHTKSLIEESSREQRALATSSTRTPADMIHAFNEASEQIGRAFPQVKIIIDDELDGRRIRLAGGQATADRIATNLVLNACQGDGSRGANIVNVHLLASRDDATVIVSDDGPGFPETMLNEPLRAFNSSKAEGTGLGLFTVDRLVQASAGLLELRGSPTGGAELELRLPLAPAAATDNEKPTHQHDPGPG